MVHVGRRIDRPERAVQSGGDEIESDVDAARQERRKAVASTDVFFYPVDVLHEICPLVAGSALDRSGAQVRRHRLQPRWFPQTRQDVVQLGAGTVVQRPKPGLARPLWNRDRYNDARASVQIVENHQRAREHENGVRSSEAILGTVGKILDEPNDVVAEVSYDSAPELTEIRNVRRFVFLDERAQIR